jgi:hypothetical protein
MKSEQDMSYGRAMILSVEEGELAVKSLGIVPPKEYAIGSANRISPPDHGETRPKADRRHGHAKQQ